LQASSVRARLPPRYLFPTILLIAVAVRVWGLGFGLPYIVARPDETEMAGPAVGFLSGDLRPPFFEWPTLFTYTTAFLYVLYFLVTRPFNAYATLAQFAEGRRQNLAPFLYVTRSLSALMGAATVWGVYAICRRVFDETVGIVAALFLALAFLHVRDSHFGVTDVAMTGLVVLAVLAILRWRDTGLLPHAGIAGLVAGLAGSTKYNGLAAGLPFVAAISQRFSSGGKAVAAAFAGFAVFAATMALGFFGASPYILIDWPRFQASVMGVSAHLAAGHGMIVGRGWWHFARVVLPAGIGWPIVLAGGLGVLVLTATRARDAAVLFAFPIAYYLVAGQSYTVFARYIIPVIPFLCIAAAWLVVSLVRAMTRRAEPHVRNAAIAAAAIAVVAPTAIKTIQLDRLLATTDNRVIVAQALVDKPPARSLYQSGEPYGYVPMMLGGRQVGRSVRYDAATGQFDPGEPELIVVQRSPLVLYSAVPASLERVLHERYELVQHFPTGDDRARVYDQQDAFYLPLGSLAGITRPGPAFDLYRRRSQ